ncbi:xanthine dehydrogenase family protein molybdopterin-binding subunit [Rhizorhabdus histidinilytica]
MEGADYRHRGGQGRHQPQGQRPFGRLRQFAAAAAKLPAPKQVKLKDASAFTLIGKDQPGRRVDSADKSTGRAKFTIDMTAPDMLTVLVARSPRFGGRVKSFDAAEALKVKGVVAVRQISSGVAVYGRGMWPAIKGRKALKVAWDDSQAEMRGTDEMIAAYLEQTRKPGRVHRATGDVDKALAAGGDVIEADYVFPYLAHAPMEPLDGFMVWDGTTARARFGSQGQTIDQGAIAKVLGIPMEKVEIETLLAGGSFGRRAQATAHLAAELAEVAKAMPVGTPVKLVWTREDDIHGGYYRPLFVHRFRGAVKDGRITAWSNTMMGQSFMIGSPFESFAVKDGIDSIMSEGASELLYEIADFRCDVHVAKSPVPTLWWRSVGHTHTGYAVECFVDQLLAAAGQDPVAGRLAMMGKSPRAAGALKAVAELAQWKGPQTANGRARGVAVVESFNSYVAQIAEVSVGTDGEPRVHKVWAAVDCGIAVNPDIIRAQVEGGIGYALGHALYAEVPLVEGVPAVSNFNDYRSLRINEMPEIEVVVVPSTAPDRDRRAGRPRSPPPSPTRSPRSAASARPACRWCGHDRPAVDGRGLRRAGRRRCGDRRRRRRQGGCSHAADGDQPAPAVGLRRDQGPQGALARAVRRGRQGHPASALHQLPPGRPAADPDRRDAAAHAAGRARRRRHGCGGHALHDLPPCREFRAGGRSRQSEMAARAGGDGLGRQIARCDLRADQGQQPQRRPQHGRARPSHGRRRAGRLGLAPRRQAHARTRHPGAVRGAVQGLGGSGLLPQLRDGLTPPRDRWRGPRRPCQIWRSPRWRAAASS